MPELTALKPNESRAVFIPQAVGVFVLLIIIGAFTAGAARQELVLILAGAVFLALWVYCLVMTLFLALLHRNRARRACIRVNPHEVASGDLVEALYSEGGGASVPVGRILQLPGILVRCRLLLATKDGRRIRCDFNPAGSQPHFFPAEKRGAYFSFGDELAIFDILGFFRFAYRLSMTTDSPRLLVSPRAADEPPAVRARAGESLLKPDFSFQRTDNMIDHRPYVPGDDPRRINWKLYGHGSGLFVREGEYEPPPQSNIIILIDSGYDPLLYSLQAARRGIDVLCENALAAALVCAARGMNVLTGYSGGVMNETALPRTGIAASLAAAFAAPAALPLSATADLPAAPGDYGILILSLPRSSAETAAIDRFLGDRANRFTGKNKSRIIDLIFICDSGRDEYLAAAEVCVALYNQRPGIRARVFGV